MNKVNEYYSMSLIGDEAPNFESITIQENVNLPDDYKGRKIV